MHIVRDPGLKRRRAERKLLAFQWGKLMLGMALAAIAVALLLDPRVTAEGFFWVAWGVGAVASLTLVLAGVGARDLFAKAAPAPNVARRTFAPEERPVPRLGEILLEEQKLISPEQLSQALTARKGSSRPLGHIMVDMGMVTSSQLEAALERQLFYREQWGAQPWQR